MMHRSEIEAGTATRLPPVSTESVTLHGNRHVFRTGGEGEPVVLIHGIAGSAATWDPVIGSIASNYRVIAPDLLGHGRSSKPRGDYSLGSHASAIRDLMEALEIPRATIAGHSMGGGIAMQFAYQFPSRCGRMVLVDSGGLGREVSIALRAANLPGTDPFLAAVTSERVRGWVSGVATQMARLGLALKPSVSHIVEHFSSLEDPAARKAFIHTARGVLDLGGQRIDATNRLYLTRDLPVLLVWGARDRLIPVAHAHRAHSLMPASRLEILDHAGHFPHQDDPRRFSEILLDFLDTTEPAELSEGLLCSVALADGRTPGWTPQPS